MQFVFGHDTILNVKHKADWKYIKEKKSQKNNTMENKTCKKHEYKIGSKVLVKSPTNLKYCMDTCSRLIKIVKINNNGAVRIKMGCVKDTYNF